MRRTALLLLCVVITFAADDIPSLSCSSEETCEEEIKNFRVSLLADEKEKSLILNRTEASYQRMKHCFLTTGGLPSEANFVRSFLYLPNCVDEFGDYLKELAAWTGVPRWLEDIGDAIDGGVWAEKICLERKGFCSFLPFREMLRTRLMFVNTMREEEIFKQVKAKCADGSACQEAVDEWLRKLPRFRLRAPYTKILHCEHCDQRYRKWYEGLDVDSIVTTITAAPSRFQSVDAVSNLVDSSFERYPVGVEEGRLDAMEANFKASHSCWGDSCFNLTWQNLTESRKLWAETRPPIRMLKDSAKSFQLRQNCWFFCYSLNVVQGFGMFQRFLIEMFSRMELSMALATSCWTDSCQQSMRHMIITRFKEAASMFAMTQLAISVDPGLSLIFLVLYALLFISAIAAVVFGIRFKLLKAQPSVSIIFVLLGVFVALRILSFGILFHAARAGSGETFSRFNEFLPTFAPLLVAGAYVQMCYFAILCVFWWNWVVAYHGELQQVREWVLKLLKGLVIFCFVAFCVTGVVLSSLQAALLEKYLNIRLTDTSVVPYLSLSCVIFLVTVILLVYCWLGGRKMKKGMDDTSRRGLNQMVGVLAFVLLSTLVTIIVLSMTVQRSGAAGLGISGINRSLDEVVHDYSVPLWFPLVLGIAAPELVIGLAILYYVLQAWQKARVMQREFSSAFESDMSDISAEPLMQGQRQVPAAYDDL